MCSACCGLLCLLTLGCHSASWRRIHRPHRSCCTPPTWTRAPSLRPHSEARYRTPHTPPGSTTGRGRSRDTDRRTCWLLCSRTETFFTTEQLEMLRRCSAWSQKTLNFQPGTVKCFSLTITKRASVVYVCRYVTVHADVQTMELVCDFASVNMSVIKIRVDQQVDNFSQDVRPPP